MSRRWPTRAWRSGDGIGTAVYVGDDAGIVTRIATPWPGNVPRELEVAFSLERTEPVLFIDVDVINEAAGPVREAMTRLRMSLRVGGAR